MEFWVKIADIVSSKKFYGPIVALLSTEIIILYINITPIITTIGP